MSAFASSQRRAFAHGDQALARRHDRAHRLVELGLEAQVAVGDDADDAALPSTTGKPEIWCVALQRHHLAHRHLRRDR